MEDVVRGPSDRVGLVDVAGTILLLALTLPVSVGLVADTRPITVIGFAIASAALAGCLLVRRIRPLTAFVGANAAMLVLLVLPNLTEGASVVMAPISLLYLMMLYSVVAETGRSFLPLAASIVGLVLITIRTTIDPADPIEWDAIALFIAAAAGLVVAVWALGRYHSTRRQYVKGIEERAWQAEALRDRAIRDGVARERRLIAREIHDVVAHSLAVVVTQTDAALLVLDREPDRARAMIGGATQVGRGAMREMRDMLTMLRDESGDPAAPADSIDDIARLVESLRATGVPIDLVVRGEPRELSAGTARAAYRVVQESLTNALKHSAGKAHCTVTLSLNPAELTVAVRDDGPGIAPTDLSSPQGQGLIGMRERMHQIGGHLEIESGAEGTCISAAIPVGKP